MSLIANRYSEAFFSLALEKNKVSEYKEDLDEVREVFKDVPLIKEFFASEKITKDEKKKLISDALEGKISKDSLNLFNLLVDKGRMTYYKEIINAYHHLANDELNIKEGLIESVRPIDKTKIAELEKTLSKNGEKVELVQKINKNLISGFKVTLDHEVIDGSMKSKVDSLKQILDRKVG